MESSAAAPGLFGQSAAGGERHHRRVGPSLRWPMLVLMDTQNGWFITENPKQTWMMTGGTPILGNPHICIILDYYNVRPPNVISWFITPSN